MNTKQVAVRYPIVFHITVSVALLLPHRYLGSRQAFQLKGVIPSSVSCQIVALISPCSISMNPTVPNCVSKLRGYVGDPGFIQRMPPTESIRST